MLKSQIDGKPFLVISVDNEKDIKNKGVYYGTQTKNYGNC